MDVFRLVVQAQSDYIRCIDDDRLEVLRCPEVDGVANRLDRRAVGQESPNEAVEAGQQRRRDCTAGRRVADRDE